MVEFFKNVMNYEIILSQTQSLSCNVSLISYFSIGICFFFLQKIIFNKTCKFKFIFYALSPFYTIFLFPFMFPINFRAIKLLIYFTIFTISIHKITHIWFSKDVICLLKERACFKTNFRIIKSFRTITIVSIILNFLFIYEYCYTLLQPLSICVIIISKSLEKVRCMV